MISDDTLEFMNGQPGAMLATRDADLQTHCHECLYTETTSEKFVGYVPLRFGRNLEENVADNAAAAAVVSRTQGDHRSVQVKGRITELAPAEPRPAIMAEFIEQVLPVMSQWMPEDTVRGVLGTLKDEPLYRFELVVEQVFDQTPGPKAGRSLSKGQS